MMVLKRTVSYLLYAKFDFSSVCTEHRLPSSNILRCILFKMLYSVKLQKLLTSLMQLSNVGTQVQCFPSAGILFTTLLLYQRFSCVAGILCIRTYMCLHHTNRHSFLHGGIAVADDHPSYTYNESSFHW